MPSIVVILQNTPKWVFALFAVLIVLGVQALRARTLPIWRFLITPVIFIGWGVASLALQSLSSPLLLADARSTRISPRRCNGERGMRDAA